MDTPVTHVADEQAAAPEETLTRVANAAAAAGRNIRVRASLQLLDPAVNQFLSWRGQIWKFEVADAVQAKVAKEGLELFFDLLARVGPAQTLAALQTVLDGLAPVQHQQEPDAIDTNAPQT